MSAAGILTSADRTVVPVAEGMDGAIVQVWSSPTGVVFRLLQVAFLATLLGAVPLAIAGCALRRIRRGRPSTGLVGVARAGVLLQLGGVVSSLLLGGLFLSEVNAHDVRRELAGPLGTVLGFVCINLVSAAFGLPAWLALGRAPRQ